MNKTIHFCSSNGELYVNNDGTVDRDKSDLDDWLLTIDRVDLAEWLNWTQMTGMESDCGDCLEFGFWDKAGRYHEPDWDWRRDVFHHKDMDDAHVNRLIEKAKAWINTYRPSSGKELTIQQLKKKIQQAENTHGNVDHIYVTVITDLF